MGERAHGRRFRRSRDQHRGVRRKKLTQSREEPLPTELCPSARTKYPAAFSAALSAFVSTNYIQILQKDVRKNVYFLV